jgi:hypothetical protein
MSEMIWRFDVAQLDEESVVHPIFAAIEQLEGFDPIEYDLNRMEQWRSFSLGRVVVDALTQRTQLVRVRARDEASGLAMIAMGKHAEQPTAIIRVPDAARASDAIDVWRRHFEDLALASALISDRRWRNALAEGGLPQDVVDEIGGMAIAWRRGHEPSSLGDVDEELSGDSPVQVVREGIFVALKFAEEPTLVDDAHIDDIERAVRLMRRT